MRRPMSLHFTYKNGELKLIENNIAAYDDLETEIEVISDASFASIASKDTMILRKAIIANAPANEEETKTLLDFVGNL